MNLVDGKILDISECDQVLDELEARIVSTLSKGAITPDMVIEACGRLVEEMNEEFYLAAMADLGFEESIGKSYINQAKEMFSKDSLKMRMIKELGENYGTPLKYTPRSSKESVEERLLPLGVLVHVAAGNMDGLPAFSVLEGLLTGNINILKLPSEEGGISVRLLQELIKVEPLLAEYIYVFEYDSKDIVHISKLVSVADGIVVWGGDEAVAAIRGLAKPNTKVIEWGHKVSFAYVSEEAVKGLFEYASSYKLEENLYKLAENIIRTRQVLCSSCQGIFIDSDSHEEVHKFCEYFLYILEEAYKISGVRIESTIKAKTALEIYTEELDSIFTGSKVYKSENCSIISYCDSELKPAIQFGNVWVKVLKKENILKKLKQYKNHLQTLCLICSKPEKDELVEMFGKTGVVHICSGDKMSSTYCGAAHDGEYPLRRYTKTLCIEL